MNNQLRLHLKLIVEVKLIIDISENHGNRKIIVKNVLFTLN